MKEEITLGDALKLQIEVCQIKSGERMVGKDKLLVLQIDTMYGQKQVVTNIGDKFSPEDLVGKKMPFILNLKPATIAKTLSEAMIVCISDKNNVELIETNLGIGSEVL